MEKRDGDYLKVTMHQLKNNISRYLRELEEDRWRAVIIYRKDKMVGLLQSSEAVSRRAKDRSKTEKT